MNIKENVVQGKLMRYCATSIHGYVDIFDRIKEIYMGYHFDYYDKIRAEEISYQLEEKYRDSI